MMIAYMCMHDEGIWVKLYTTWELLPIWFVSCVYAAKMELLTNLSYFCVIMFVMHKTWCHSKYPAWITNMANTLKSPASKRILQVKCISYYCGIYTLLSYCELRSICKFHTGCINCIFLNKMRKHHNWCSISRVFWIPVISPGCTRNMCHKYI